MDDTFKINRIKDYYQTAELFLALPDMGRYLIGMHFHAATSEEFRLNPDNMSVKIFKVVLQKNKYLEFKNMVRNYKIQYGLKQ